MTLTLTGGACSPDGYTREGCVLVNGSVQGPTIVAPVGSVVQVTLRNELPSDAASVHFHGVHMLGTPYFDGADMISQSSVPGGRAMTLRFLAWPPGTHWYHGHAALDYADGLRGLFVVTDDAHDPYAACASAEASLLFAEWQHSSAAQLYVWHVAMGGGTARTTGGALGLANRGFNTSLVNALYWAGGLVNGVGHSWGLTAYDRYVTEYAGGATNAFYHVRVAQGSTTRLRLAHGGFYWELLLQIASHNVTVIQADGASVMPVVVESMVIAPGERYDVLLTADRPCGNYTILW